MMIHLRFFLHLLLLKCRKGEIEYEDHQFISQFFFLWGVEAFRLSHSRQCGIQSTLKAFQFSLSLFFIYFSLFYNFFDFKIDFFLSPNLNIKFSLSRKRTFNGLIKNYATIKC